MPNLDGYQATAKLREASVNIPVIALSAHAMAQDRARSLAAGCNAHITKPINKSELLNIILENLALRSSEPR